MRCKKNKNKQIKTMFCKTLSKISYQIPVAVDCKTIFFVLNISRFCMAHQGLVILHYFYSILQCDLPPLRPYFGEAPGRDANGWSRSRDSGHKTIKPPSSFKKIPHNSFHVKKAIYKQCTAKL